MKDSSGNTLKSYTYNSLGRRITETTGSGTSAVTTTLYYNASWQVTEERMVDTATGITTTTQYVWSATYIDAMVARDQTITTSSGTTQQRIYAIHDANFNVTAIADSTGQIIERYVYDAYGKFIILNPDGTTKTTQVTALGWQYLHQGGRYDADTGLYHFRNRDYNPDTQRWMQQDPLGYVDGASMYQYVCGNPTTLYDPSGLDSIDDYYRNKKGQQANTTQPTTRPETQPATQLSTQPPATQPATSQPSTRAFAIKL